MPNPTHYSAGNVPPYGLTLDPTPQGSFDQPTEPWNIQPLVHPNRDERLNAQPLKATPPKNKPQSGRRPSPKRPPNSQR